MMGRRATALLGNMLVKEDLNFLLYIRVFILFCTNFIIQENYI
jgi:hypothetical protein